MNRLRRLLEGSRNPVARKRSVNAAVRWLMWDPNRANTIIMSTFVVILLAVAVFLARGAMWAQTVTYEAEVAKATATPTETGPAIQPLSEAQQTPTATGPTTSGTATTTAPEANVEKAPQEAARAFLAAWSAAPRMTSQTAWLDALRPYTAPELLALFKATDRANVPDVKVTTMTSVTVPELHTSHVSAAVAKGSVALVLTDTSGRWLVTDVAPE